MPPRLQPRSDVNLFTCTSEKIYIALAIAAIIWIGGIFSMIGTGKNSSSLILTGTAHTHQSGSSGITTTDTHHHPPLDEHRIVPRRNAPDARPSSQRPSSGETRNSRGYGLSQLEEIQQGLQQGLHQIFKHGSEDEERAKRKRAASHAGMTNPAVVIITYQRQAYLIRAIDSLLTARGVNEYQLYISQDGSDPDLTEMITSYQPKANITLLNHPRIPLASSEQPATAYLAQHYKWALDHLFLKQNHSHVVIMEDDMLVSPDFLTLFKDTATLLDTDPSLFCVSSWNDNGHRRLVADPKRLMRTNYFPGLGWMTNRVVWTELSPIFPLDQWDHFMRLDTTHKGRDCIIPEIARNKNIGEEGTNMGDGFFDKYLAPIAWIEPGSNDTVDTFMRPDTTRTTTTTTSFFASRSSSKPTPHLSMEYMRSSNFEATLKAELASATILGTYPDDPTVYTWLTTEYIQDPVREETKRVIVLYERNDWRDLAEVFGLLQVPRAIHEGIITIRLGTNLVYLIDIKLCPFLPTQYRYLRDPTLIPTVAAVNEPCTTACEKVSMQCDPESFQFLNQCSELKKVFPCPNGCIGGVSGPDIPNYVTSIEKPEMLGYCLTTESRSECEAAHWSAQRLCPCIRKKR